MGEVLRIRMLQSPIKVFKHFFRIGHPGRRRGGAHFFVPLPHCHRHAALAHERPDQCVSLSQTLRYAAQDAFKVCRLAPKARSAKQEHFLSADFGEKTRGCRIAGPLVRPEADVEAIRRQSPIIRRPHIQTCLLPKGCPNRLGQLFRVSGPAAVNDGAGHFPFLLS